MIKGSPEVAERPEKAAFQGWDFDCLVVGAGFAGAAAARALADKGRRVLVVDKRPHIGGNAYDCMDEHGILVHRYGPHIFHTNNAQVFRFLSRFSEWSDYRHEVVGNIGGRLIPIPFNLNSLAAAFDVKTAQRLRSKLIDICGMEQKISITDLRRQDDPDLKALAEYIYENVFLGYTQKQWGLAPHEIDPAVIARVPVFVSYDNRYFQDTYQGMPKRGYTALFLQMLDHPRIRLMLGTDACGRLTFKGAGAFWEGQAFGGPIIYTGAVDELCGFVFGELPYRTLKFEFETLFIDCFQPKGTVNYPVSEAFTRITEFKHMTGQRVPGKTTIVREYPRACRTSDGDIPYYPIVSDNNLSLYRQYTDLLSPVKNLHLAGRLAKYRYYNMDAVVADALDLSDKLTERP